MCSLFGLYHILQNLHDSYKNWYLKWDIIFNGYSECNSANVGSTLGLCWTFLQNENSKNFKTSCLTILVKINHEEIFSISTLCNNGPTLSCQRQLRANKNATSQHWPNKVMMSGKAKQHGCLCLRRLQQEKSLASLDIPLCSTLILCSTMTIETTGSFVPSITTNNKISAEQTRMSSDVKGCSSFTFGRNDCRNM